MQNRVPCLPRGVEPARACEVIVGVNQKICLYLAFCLSVFAGKNGKPDVLNLFRISTQAKERLFADDSDRRKGHPCGVVLPQEFWLS